MEVEPLLGTKGPLAGPRGKLARWARHMGTHSTLGEVAAGAAAEQGAEEPIVSPTGVVRQRRGKGHPWSPTESKRQAGRGRCCVVRRHERRCRGTPSVVVAEVEGDEMKENKAKMRDALGG